MKYPSVLIPHRLPHRRFQRLKAGSGRSLQSESLERRDLFAVGPQLISIQPNAGDVLRDGSVLNVAPHQLTFVFDEAQKIDADTLAGIRVTRAGFDNTFDGVSDILVQPGYVGVADDRLNAVIVRFAETLPDDLYRIDVFAVDDPSKGWVALRNEDGAAFQPALPGANRTTVNFELNLGAQVLAVVPQPVRRDASGLVQARNQIEVYFNNDTLDRASATNPAFYRLYYTGGTASNTDDAIVRPTKVEYNASANRVTLTFASNLEGLSTGAGVYRLRVGSDEPLPVQPTFQPVNSDPGSSFAKATDLGSLDKARVLSSGIGAEDYPLQFPGSLAEPGHRVINEVESHFSGEADETPGISVQPYNFKRQYGFDSSGRLLTNLITEQQKQRAREIFEVYGFYLGVQFVETADEGFTIVTGDIRALDPTAEVGPAGILGIAGDANPDPLITWPTAIMDAAELWDDKTGETTDPARFSWYDTAMHEIGHLLGLGHTYDLSPFTLMGEEPSTSFGTLPEWVFPGDHDIVHGQYLHRPESNDLDVYRFRLDAPGEMTAEILAERRTKVSQLDAVLTLYKATSGQPELIARNDDYFSEDSFIGLNLDAGDYFIVVTSTGNTAFDPTVEGTGLGGTTQGEYDLRLDFRKRVDNFLIDNTGVALDGDADGTPGGEYNFWFRVENTEKTAFVDKSAAAGGDGSLAKPYNNLKVALASPRIASGGVLRVLGNGGADGNMGTLADNKAYEIGLSGGKVLSDGQNLQVPRNVAMMVDSGAIFKMAKSIVQVGSSSVNIDASGAALQVLGTPASHVIFTSYDDQATGVDTNPLQTTPDPGDWGGLLIRNDVDRSERRGDYEQQGAFLNYVSEADIRYGGGNVTIDSIQQVVNPVHLVDARPTIRNNIIRFSADAAISANPDSFEETNFNAVDSLGVDYQKVPFTADYDRVGPDIRSNQLVNNSINGLFVRIDTPAGDQLEKMTVSGRWDDTDIVHVATENLVIQGTPGGPAKDRTTGTLVARTDAQLKIDPSVVVKLDGTRVEVEFSAQLLAEGLEGQEVVFTSLQDGRYGAGGTFQTNGNSSGSAAQAKPGDWSGIRLSPTSRASLDHILLAYGGGLSRVEGTFAAFNALEAHQAVLRLANSVLTDNENGRGGQADATRGGRGQNDEAVVFVRGAQPVVLNNVIKNTIGYNAPAISINLNSLNYFLVNDPGRSTGLVNLVGDFGDNQGPLVRLNKLSNNPVNGMLVRGGVLNTEGVWDDTDIVHVVFDAINVPNLHSFGGLRLESSPSESLVVKFGGPTAGLTATGTLLDIEDRIGGTVHIIGQPGMPVVLTALNDDTVGAGFDPSGSPQTDTDGFRREGAREPSGSFQLDLNYGPLIKARPQYVAAMELAARFWERWVEDPIVVSLDLEIDPAMFNTGTLGLAAPEYVTLDWDQVRQSMISDARLHEEGTLEELPRYTEAEFTLPNEPANPFSVLRQMRITRANAKALGIDVTGLPSVPSQYDPTKIRDASITFAPNPYSFQPPALPQMFDVDRLDGVTPGFVDLVGTAIHEIGHALGWVSSVDDVVAALGDPAAPRGISISTVDMFRMEPGDGADYGMKDAARVLDPTLTQVFYDGGVYDPFGLPIPNLRRGDIPLASENASHWLEAIPPLGIMNPSAAGGEDWFSEADRTGFDLIGWDVIGDPVAGDWRGVTLEQYSHDRNVSVVTEYEDPATVAPGLNSLPSTAQVLGRMGRGEKDSDENLRLGFTVHGYVSDATDVDVYSFVATAGTEVWLDVDRTANKLDSVVELIDASGTVLARSDNSYAESQGAKTLYGATGVFVSGLQKSLFYDQDFGTTNVFDAGLRVTLPGATGTVGTYFVRVRSASENLDVVSGGKTSGMYELEVRLDEVDEYGGSTILYSDIRYAMSGIRARGLPGHSPLGGEIAEDVWYDEFGNPIDNNDALALPENSRVLLRPVPGLPLDPTNPPNPTDPNAVPTNIPPVFVDSFQDAQYIGNILQSDRAAISVAGLMDNTVRSSTGRSDNVDWYLFEVRFASIQQPGGHTGEFTFDLDYADGLSRPDFTLAIYEADFLAEPPPVDPAAPPPVVPTVLTPEVSPGTLVYHSLQGGGVDDHPAPLQGANMDDLSRGSVGNADPFIGPISLREGFYLMQVTNPAVNQFEREQYSKRLAPNPYIRFEPVESIARIAEDRIAEPITEDGQGTTFNPPQVPLLLDPGKAAVPYFLGDVELFVSNSNSLFTVDAFTGAREVAFGALTGVDGAAGYRPSIGDFALRDNPFFDPTSPDPNVARGQRLMAFANDRGTGAEPSDATLGNYIWIDVQDESLAPPPAVVVRGVGENGAVTDDTVLTFGPDPESEDPTNPEVVPLDEGIYYDAIVFDPTSVDISAGYAIGRRPASRLFNILLKFDAVTGQVLGDPQDEAERLPVPNPVPTPKPQVPTRQPNGGLDIIEQGVLDTTVGGGPGGNITGMDFIGSTLYAVSDKGGLYRINGFSGTGARLTYIATISLPGATEADPPVPVRFAGLTAGPKTAEAGAYRTTLFGIDNRGFLVAFDTAGVLKPVFVDGKSFVPTGVGGATGIEFGTLDTNLWHVTQQRGGDDGHGRLFPNPQPGGASFYFGEEINPGGGAPRYYDHLGGAKGSIVTNPFSLEGYDAANDPFVYFNYFMVTEEGQGQGATPGRDTFRVFVADDSREDGRGQWHLLASSQNREVGLGALDVDPMDNILINVQPLFDNTWQDVPFLQGTPPGRNGVRDPFPYPDTPNLRPFDPLGTPWPEFDPPLNETKGVWRQARISLKDFAGSGELRLRFDFSTAGSFDIGKTAGSELRAIAGNRLRDGDTFTIADKVFEFDLGYTLIASSGRRVVDGETFSIENAEKQRVTFEMDSNGSVAAGHIAVAYSSSQTGQEIADSIVAAIKASAPTGVVPHQEGIRINLAGALKLELSAGSSLSSEGAPGTGENIPVVVHAGMKAEDVAKAMVKPLADTFAAGVLSAIKVAGPAVSIIGHRVSNPGPLGLTSQLPGDNLGAFNSPLRAQNVAPKLNRNDERLYSFPDETQNFTVPFEGLYVDDLIVGFSAFGERGADLRPPVDPQFPDPFEADGGAVSNVVPPPGTILTGEYQVEIRRAADYSNGIIPFRTFDPRDRLSDSVGLLVPAGVDAYDGLAFFVSDGRNRVDFEFEEEGLNNGVRPGRVPVPFAPADSAFTLVERIRDLINGFYLDKKLAVTAAGTNGAAVGSVGTSDRLNLFGTPVVVGGDLESVVLQESGSQNRFRDQGQIILNGNRVRDAALFGIVVEDSLRDFPCSPGQPSDGLPGFCLANPFDPFDEVKHSQGSAGDYTPSFGASRNLREINDQHLTPAVVISNNVISGSGEGGIRFNGDPSGHVIVGPTGGAPNEQEIFADPSLHYLLAITDNNGLTQVLEFKTPDQTPLPISFATIDWVPDPIADRQEMAAAIYAAIAKSNLDVKPYLTKLDEVYLEGVRDIKSQIIRGAADAGGGDPQLPGNGTVTFTADEWFYPFHWKSQQSVVPFGRIVNNTIVGRGGTLDQVELTPASPLEDVLRNKDFIDVGILVEDYADPTILNNVVVNFNTGIRVDQTSRTAILGGTLFQGNIDNTRNINRGDFVIEVPNDVQLFVNREQGNFYPAAQSPLIDSSVDSLEDRASLVTVKEPLGISRSPILAPAFDALGQLRIDDPTVEAPEGLGRNVFKDRGAIDRVDFVGPIAQFRIPLDNDPSGVDQNPAVDIVRLENATLSSFVIQLLDLGEDGAATGTGIDDAMVTSESVIVRRDGKVLVPGVDYRFDYQATTNQILLTPQAGIWLTGYTYDIQLLNRDFIAVASGVPVPDGTVVRIDDRKGNSQLFEFDSGYAVVVPEPLALVIGSSLGGVPNVSDGESFTIAVGTRSVTFEFDSNGSVASGRTPVNIQGASTTDQVADATAAAINGANLGLASQNLGAGKVHVGGPFNTTLDTSGSRLSKTGSAGAVTDGQRFTVRNGTRVGAFEFNNNGAVTAGRTPVPFTVNSTQRELAQAVAQAINGAALGVTAIVGPGGVVTLSGASNLQIDVENSSLQRQGQPGTSTPGALAITYVPTESTTQATLSQLLADAIAKSSLSGVSTAIDPAGRLIVEGASTVDGLPNQSIGGIRDIAGNVLQTNQQTAPFATILTVELPAALDFGDAPDSPYASKLTNDGPRHVVVPNVYLGFGLDSELDARQNATASGDLFDDGVTFSGKVTPGKTTELTVTASINGFLDGWLDLDQDGSFQSARDRVISRVALVRGANTLSINVPADAKLGTTFARFRFSTLGGLAPTGRADNGEVEDYQVQVSPFVPFPWQNAANPLDVDNSGQVVPLDALLVINEINQRGSRPLPPPPISSSPFSPPPYLDVTGDGFLSPLDALRVINYLNTPQRARAAVPASLVDTQIVGAALDIEPRKAAPVSVVEQAFAAPARSGQATAVIGPAPEAGSIWDVGPESEPGEASDWLADVATALALDSLDDRSDA
jgi:hypothetical protein